MLFPGSLPVAGTAVSTDTLAAAGHTSLHNTDRDEIRAVATKLGTGSATASSGTVLRGNGAGTSTWGQVVLTTDVSGILPIANGGTGTASTTGTGSVVYGTSPTISTPTINTATLITPIITDYTNATHTHATNAQGGQLGTAAHQNTSITPDKLAIGAVNASETSSSGTTTSTSYTATLSSGGTNPAVTATIGVNAVALVIIYSWSNDNGANVATFTGFAVSGASTIAADDSRSIKYSIPTGGGSGGYGAMFYLDATDGLAAGSNTFTMQYRVASGTGTYSNRRITVIPL